MNNFNARVFLGTIFVLLVVFLFSNHYDRRFLKAGLDKTLVPEEFVVSLTKKFRRGVTTEYANRLKVLMDAYSAAELGLPITLTGNVGRGGLYQVAPSFERGVLFDQMEELVGKYEEMVGEIGPDGVAANEKIMKKCIASTSSFKEFDRTIKALEKGLKDAKNQKDFVTNFMRGEFNEFLKVREELLNPNTILTASQRAEKEARFRVLQKVFDLADKAEALADLKMQRAYLEAFGDLTKEASAKFDRLEKKLITETNNINDEIRALASREGKKVLEAAEKLSENVDDVIKQAAKLKEALEDGSKKAGKCKGCGPLSGLKSKLISLGALITVVDWGSKYSAGVFGGVELVKNKLEKARSACFNLEVDDGLFTKVINFFSNYQKRYNLVTIPFIGEPIPTPSVPYEVDLNSEEVSNLLNQLSIKCPEAFRAMMLTDDGAGVDLDFINSLSQLAQVVYYFSLPSDVDKYLKEFTLRREIKNNCNDPYARLQNKIDLIKNNPIYRYCNGDVTKFDADNYEAMEDLLMQTYAYMLRNDYSNSDRKNEGKVLEMAKKLAEEHIKDVKAGKEEADLCRGFMDADLGNGLKPADLLGLNVKKYDLIEACNNRCVALSISDDKQLCYDLMSAGLSFDIADNIYKVKPGDVLSASSL